MDIVIDTAVASEVLAPVAAVKKTRKKTAQRKVKPAASEAVPANREDRGARTIRRATQKKLFLGIALGVITLTVLSLSHLALGISIVTGHAEANWQDWTFALTFDVIMMIVKLSMIFSKPNQFNKEVHSFGAYFVIGCLAMSAGLNALAFAYEAHGIMVYPAIIFGVLIPAGLYSLTKIGSALYMDYSRA